MTTPEQYQHLFDTMIVRTDKLFAATAIEQKIKALFPKYQNVSDIAHVPIPFIAITHSMECSSNFNKHLHNGDPLTARTTHVPAGRPITGEPPFTWDESAIDALQLLGYDKITDWSIPNMLYLFEKYNGFGYQKRGINSPYLFSWSDLYDKGKYGADGKFDPNLVSQQCGAAVLLKLLLN